jgi:hypothetical protein
MAWLFGAALIPRNHQTARRTGRLPRSFEDLKANLLAGRPDYPFRTPEAFDQDQRQWSLVRA